MDVTAKIRVEMQVPANTSEDAEQYVQDLADGKFSDLIDGKIKELEPEILWITQGGINMYGRKAHYAPVIYWNESKPKKKVNYKKAETKPVPRSKYYNELFYSYFKGWE